jgi:hypothetical protein
MTLNTNTKNTKSLVALTLILLTGSLSVNAQPSEEYDPTEDPIFSEPITEPITQTQTSQTHVVIPNQNTTRGEIVGKSNSGQPIYILNQSTPTATAQNQAAQVQKQPTTVIEASPVGDSKAEQLRKSRQDTELQTELKIVEKLEQDRMESEKKRADVLFGDRFQTLQNGSTVQAQQAPIQTTQPQPQVAVAPQNNSIENDLRNRPSEASLIREEVRAAVAEQSLNDESGNLDQELYFKGQFGMIDFADAANVRGNGAVGLGVGGRYNDRLLAEANFIFASFTKEYPISTDISQYTIDGQFKYQVLPGMLRPVLGLALDYNYRSYYNNYSYSSSQPTSNSFDVGLIVGADVEISRKFSIGGEFKYTKNIMNKTNGYYPVIYGNEVPLDQLSSYTFNLNSKFVF